MKPMRKKKQLLLLLKVMVQLKVDQRMRAMSTRLSLHLEKRLLISFFFFSFFFENFGCLLFQGFNLKTLDILDASCFEAFISRF